MLFDSTVLHQANCNIYIKAPMGIHPDAGFAACTCAPKIITSCIKCGRPINVNDLFVEIRNHLACYSGELNGIHQHHVQNMSDSHVHHRQLPLFEDLPPFNTKE